ncbi:MAG: M48 family metallopeptidase [Bifidobacteriaceae bacterium]|jgi:predicted metal-dependent hydrolase|nr:M48 family metallopeptidase [Bifidobacteriaceae bacterium]
MTYTYWVEQLEVDELPIEVRVKDVKRARLRITTAGKVWFSVPPSMGAQGAVEMMRKNRAWIDTHLAAVKAAQLAPLTLWGSQVPDAALPTSVNTLFRAELSQALQDLQPRWRYLAGDQPLRFNYRWMDTRWGSCNAFRRRITMNPALAALEPRFLEEVLVHELVHLTHPNHGPGFRAMMDSTLPSWELIAADLRRIRPMPKPAR